MCGIAVCITQFGFVVPTLDLHPNILNAKRPAVGSPTQPTSPGMPSILSSPVGEFKGWFSNLFNWRAHTYVLCSTNNLAATRMETIRILEQLGIAIVPEDADGMQAGAALRCRTNEVVDGTTGAVVQKHVRFRIEFSVGSAQVGGFVAPNIGTGSSPTSGPNISTGVGTYVGGMPMSPTGTSTSMSSSLLPSRHTLGKQATVAGYACAIMLVQEKGSLSTFRAVCRWLREEWTLDALRSPPVGVGGQPSFFEQQQQQFQGAAMQKRGAML